MRNVFMRSGFPQAPVFADAAADKAAADAAAAGGDKKADDRPAGDQSAQNKAADDKAAADKLAADAAAAAAKDGKSGGDATGDKAGEGNPAPKVPKDYALTIPEGGYLTESDLARVRTAAEIYGWDEAQTQQEINLHASHVKALSESFLSEAKADAEYGGQNFDRTRALADKALARVRPEGHPRAEAFRQLLARSGYNHNVEVLALLADFGKTKVT